MRFIHASYCILFLIPVSGTTTRTVYVTQDARAKDQNDCGSYVLPCKTITYAVNIAKPSDIILIDCKYNINIT